MEKWWQKSVFYQIYPRSFQDSNHDGIGDLKGVIQRLPYLQSLGINAIWLSPVFASPNIDNGYDISDYCAIMPEFGDMAIMTELIEESKKRNIRIIIDLVVNHTSNQHPWFQKALAGETSYKEYYLFRDGHDSEPPNNLQSFFGGSAWEYLPEQNQYYFHLFAKEQPDLNWHNPALRAEIWKIMRFWRDKGIGGFRLDVIDLIGKEPDDGIIGNGPMLHPYLQEMYSEVLEGTDLVTIGETGSVTTETAPLFTNPERKELSMVFQFQHMALDEIKGKTKWDLQDLQIKDLKSVLSKWQTELPTTAWNSLFWSNHDQPRILSRWGNPAYPTQSAQMLAILLHMMRGTPFIYQGEELGMTNQVITNVEQLDDIESINYYHNQIAHGSISRKALLSINAKGRDNARTPMQWSADKYAGFSTCEPWYPINSNFKTINAKSQISNPDSLFHTYRQLIRLRKENEIVQKGKYELLNTKENIFAYTRQLEKDIWLVCGNFSDQPQQFTLPTASEKTILSNYHKTYEGKHTLLLEPYESFIIKIASNY